MKQLTGIPLAFPLSWLIQQSAAIAVTMATCPVCPEGLAESIPERV